RPGAALVRAGPLGRSEEERLEGGPVAARSRRATRRARPAGARESPHARPEGGRRRARHRGQGSLRRLAREREPRARLPQRAGLEGRGLAGDQCLRRHEPRDGRRLAGRARARRGNAGVSMEPQQLIRRPLITEKSTRLKEASNTICFEVDRTANKIEIRKAVERLFGVKVTSVRVANRQGKWKRMGR